MKGKILSTLLCGCLFMSAFLGCQISGAPENRGDEETQVVETASKQTQKETAETEEVKDSETEDKESTVRAGNTSVEIPSGTLNGQVYENKLTVSEGEGENAAVVYETTYFAYVPECDTYGDRSTASPILMVYGDQPYTTESVMQTAINSGLAQIADIEHAPVIFMNPSEDTWSGADIASYLGVKSLYSDSHDAADTFFEGKNENSGSYPGTCTRMYIFAEGAGANFVYENLAQGVYGSGQYMGNAVWKPVGVFLLNPTSEAVIDLAGCTADGYEYLEIDQKREVPAIIVNGSEQVQNAFTQINQSKNLSIVESDAKDLSSAKDALLIGYDEIMEHHMTRDAGFGVSLLELPDAASLGLIETRETFSASTGAQLDYFQYLPQNIEQAENGTVPLLFGFHGGGNSAEMYAWSAGWPQIAGEKGFAFVSVDLHVDYVDEIVELANALIEKYPAIDAQRLYAAGFSMGSIKSSTLGFTYDKLFAAINPTNAISFLEPVNGNIVPTFYNAGENSHFNMPFMMEGTKAEVPTTNLEGRAAFGKLLVSNGVIGDISEYTFDENVDKMYGIAGARTETVECAEYNNVTATLRYYDSADGNCYTIMSTTSNAIHEPIWTVSREAWKFMSQFSRNEDGTLSIHNK